MQNLIQKFTFGLAIISLPFISFAGNRDNSKTLIVPKEAKSLINKTKEITVSEVAISNFTGTYTGKRYQYNANHTEVLRTYTYTMEIVQTGTQISGITHIIADNGDFADIKLRGLVMSNKMYFEEYEIANQQKSDQMVWCFKVGELQLGKNKGNTIIYGPTNSYTSVYYLPCTGGFTVLEKEGINNNTNNAKENKEVSVLTDNSNMDIVVYPNPFINTINTNFSINKDSKVTIELFDINGRLINILMNETKLAGEYNIPMDASKMANGVYVIKLNINGVITSKQVIKSASN